MDTTQDPVAIDMKEERKQEEVKTEEKEEKQEEKEEQKEEKKEDKGKSEVKPRDSWESHVQPHGDLEVLYPERLWQVRMMGFD